MFQLSSIFSIAPAIALPVWDPLNSFACSTTLSRLKVSMSTQWAVKLSKESGETSLLKISVVKLMACTFSSFLETCSVTFFLIAGTAVSDVFAAWDLVFWYCVSHKKPESHVVNKGEGQVTEHSHFGNFLGHLSCCFTLLVPLVLPLKRTDQSLLLWSIPLSLARSCRRLKLFVFVRMFRSQVFNQVRGIKTERFSSTSCNFQTANLACRCCTRWSFYIEILPNRWHFLSSGTLVCFSSTWESFPAIG